MSISNLKQNARQKLSGGYLKAFLGALVYYIAIYVMSMINMVLFVGGTRLGIVALVLTEVINICVAEIILVGYMRSLLEMNNRGEFSDNSKGEFDVNRVMSGYQQNFKNTVKTLFFRRLYLFGWGFLAGMPCILASGVIAFLSSRPEIAQLLTQISQFVNSPTDMMIFNIADFITANCMYVVYIISGAVVLSLILMIPYVIKTYEYAMIPMILAENPDIEKDEAFRRTKEIMTGYRFKYFILQLSFIGLYIIVSAVAMLIPMVFVSYIAMAAVMPYIQMTCLQFYIERRRTGSFEEVSVYTELPENAVDDETV